jgi:hypothetical protein
MVLRDNPWKQEREAKERLNEKYCESKHGGKSHRSNKRGEQRRKPCDEKRETRKTRKVGTRETKQKLEKRGGRKENDIVQGEQKRRRPGRRVKKTSLREAWGSIMSTRIFMSTYICNKYHRIRTLSSLTLAMNIMDQRRNKTRYG